VPSYTLICSEPLCGKKMPEIFCTMTERGELYCPGCGCFNTLVNDYARHKSAAFTLKGDNWPSKMLRTEKAMLE
jgi:hypothetical protein